MKRLLSMGLIASFSMGLAGCSGMHHSRAGAGTVLGGVAGGVAGSHFGGGHGRTAGIIAGTLIGALIGHEIGRSIDQADELQAARVLEGNRTGQPSTWVNPDTKSQVTVTPTRTYEVADNQHCREYTTEVQVGGQTQSAYGTACRQPDGSWRVTN